MSKLSDVFHSFTGSKLSAVLGGGTPAPTPVQTPAPAAATPINYTYIAGAVLIAVVAGSMLTRRR